jgi:hypothetical protein
MSRSESHPTSTPNRRVGRIVRNTVGVVAAAALLPAAVFGISKLSEKESEGTHFATAAAAMSTLRADAKAHGDDQDCFGPDQGKMEKDLRGANPLLMRQLGQKVVTAAAHPGTMTLKDGSVLSIMSLTLDGGQKVDEVDLTDSATQNETRVSLSFNSDGSFSQLTYDDGGTSTNPNDIMGGPHFDYGFGGNDFEDSSTAQYGDGRPLTSIPGSAIMVNNTYFSPMMAAGPAIETVVTDYDNADHFVTGALAE